MPDHVSATLVVHALPRQGARAVMELIEAQGLTDGLDAAETGVLLGVPYVAHDWASGALDHIESILGDIPEAAWTAWYDPDTEGLGEVLRFVPGLGLFRGACDGDGHPLFSDGEIRAAMDKGRTQRVLVDAHYLYELIGQRWHDAVEALNATAERRVTPPVAYDVMWDTRGGVVEIEPASGGNVIELEGPKTTRRPAAGAESVAADAWQTRAAAAIGAFLREQGWTLAEGWDFAARGRVWSTTAYRSVELDEVSA